MFEKKKGNQEENVLLFKVVMFFSFSCAYLI